MIRIIFLSAMLSVAACAEQTESAAASDPQAQAQAALAVAQERYALSVDRGFAWRDALKQLEAAQNAFDAGDNGAALTAAQKAAELAALSLEQADAEAQAWQTRAPFGS
ncbi:MAG: hypothetical protein ACR2PZ_22200 [Pseudomonadales bacterium]